MAAVNDLQHALLAEAWVGDHKLIEVLRFKGLVELSWPDNANDLNRICAARGKRGADSLGVRANPHQQCATTVTGGAQNSSADAVIERAKRPNDHNGKDQRAPEDVVAGEVAADDQRVDQRDQRDREERRDDGAEPGP